MNCAQRSCLVRNSKNCAGEKRRLGRLRLLVVRVFLNRVADFHDALEVVASLFDLLRIDRARLFDDGISHEVLDLLAKQ